MSRKNRNRHGRPASLPNLSANAAQANNQNTEKSLAGWQTAIRNMHEDTSANDCLAVEPDLLAIDLTPVVAAAGEYGAAGDYAADADPADAEAGEYQDDAGKCPEPEPEQEQEQAPEFNDTQHATTQPGAGRSRRPTQIAFDLSQALPLFVEYLLMLREETARVDLAERMAEWTKNGSKGARPVAHPNQSWNYAFDQAFIRDSLTELTGSPVELTSNLGVMLRQAAEEKEQVIVAVDTDAFVMLDKPTLMAGLWWLDKRDLPQFQTTSTRKLTSRLTTVEQLVIDHMAQRMKTDNSTVVREGVALMSELISKTGVNSLEEARELMGNLMEELNKRK